jgi:hypothetical protein
MTAGRITAVAALLATMGSGAASCSLANRRGPDATCATLSDGKINDCRDGILASCVAGALQYKVCDDAAACSASWQEAGAYRCLSSDTAAWGVGGGTTPNPDGGTPPNDSGGTGDCKTLGICTVATSGGPGGDADLSGPLKLAHKHG